jgi:hypothetical protein
MAEIDLRSTKPAWPPLEVGEGRATFATLHRWTQIVGKIRLAQSPKVNHWWGTTLYVTPRGLTTTSMPYGNRAFQIDFDFIDHELRVATNDGATRSIELRPKSVATFYREVMAALESVGLPVHIWTMPVEIPDPVPFERDEQNASYDPEQAHRLWELLVQADRVMNVFRCRYVGKVSPVHFFWGGFDLAVTRFSGRRAPEHPGMPWMADSVTREAYSHEVSSAGFWLGTAEQPPVFYSYAYPEPAGFSSAAVRPESAFYSPELGEFFLPYDALHGAEDADELLLDFLQSTYEAAADYGDWDRAALEV